MEATQLESLGRIVQAKHTIPALYIKELLPDAKLSIRELIHFQFPPLLSSPGKTSAYSFVSSERPTVSNDSGIQNMLRQIPIPATETLLELTKFATGGHPNFCSLVCPHTRAAIGERLPLWVISFWLKAFKTITASVRPWICADEHLTRLEDNWKKANTKKSLAKLTETQKALSELPWTSQIQSIDIPDPVHELTTYASREWLSDVHENQMLELLRLGVEHDKDLRGSVVVKGVFFYPSLLSAFKEGTDTYANAKHFRQFRQLGTSLSSGFHSKLATIININQNHWISIMLDFENSLALIADSQGEKPNAEVIQVLSWWTNIHTGRDFRLMNLAITKQSDSHLCGQLCFNALEHFLFPNTVPLTDAGHVDEARLDVLVCLANRTMNKDFAMSSTTGFDFTFPNGGLSPSFISSATLSPYMSDSPPSNDKTDSSPSEPTESDHDSIDAVRRKLSFSGSLDSGPPSSIAIDSDDVSTQSTKSASSDDSSMLFSSGRKTNLV